MTINVIWNVIETKELMLGWVVSAVSAGCFNRSGEGLARCR